jgi:hypothetical protein
LYACMRVIERRGLERSRRGAKRRNLELGVHFPSRRL